MILGITDKKWKKMSNVFECWSKETYFLGNSEDLYFRLFSKKKLEKFPKKFRCAPKNRVLYHFCATFLISENFSKTAPSAPFSAASRPKTAGLICGSKAPQRPRPPPWGPLIHICTRIIALWLVLLPRCTVATATISY